MVGSQEAVGEELRFRGASHPVIMELNRLENQLKEKERELGVVHAEVRSLKATKALKDKAVMELSNELKKLEDKLGAAEKLLEDKNLEIRRLVMEKKEATTAQLAAETALRRVHATQRDEDPVPLEAVIAPLEADIKMYKNEVAVLQEDKKALERITKSKEMALIEADNFLKSALERASIVENVQNENFELRRRIEIIQEENKILDKINRHKVMEVEKLSQTIHDLEESILAGGATANVVRDYQRQVSELNEEKRTLERELARARVSVNRVATVVAKEWKNDDNKVIPAKQWVEERRILQGEIQRLHYKLRISEKTAKAEAPLKGKLRLWLKTLEEGLKHVSALSNKQGGLKTRHASEEHLVKNNLWAPRSNLFDDCGEENKKRVSMEKSAELIEGTSESAEGATFAGKNETDRGANAELHDTSLSGVGVDDLVSGFLYDRLQKGVISLRKSHEEKDVILNTKDGEIKMLVEKIEVLTRAMEIDSKKIRQSTRAREVQMVNSDDNMKKTKTQEPLKESQSIWKP